MDALPTEILIQIFAYCTLYNYVLPATLSRVSRHFYSIVHSTPEIWTLITATPPYNRTNWRLQTSLYIARSHPLLIDIDVRSEEDKPELILPLLAPLWKIWRRWRSIRVNGHRLRVDEATHISTLHIGIGNDYGAPPPTIWKPSYRLLTNGVGDDERIPSMSMDTIKFPFYEPLCAPLSFTVLAIQDHTDQATTAKLASLLRCCPNLKMFSYVGASPSSSSEMEPDRACSPPLLLKKLHSVVISRTYLARPILSSLALPRLRILSLDSLNVEAELPTFTIEPGDSDDEAEDFSRSPSSDRMTGVGLLRLLEHSPGNLKGLKKLRMDFTDIRTRDFRVIFRELEGLEAFKIVGSDLSDGVVRFLGVHHVGHHQDAAPGNAEALRGDVGMEEEVEGSQRGLRSDDAEDDVEFVGRKGTNAEGARGTLANQQPNGDSGTRALVWMPNLETLQLVSCPQASGSVLVSTLISRFRFTQARAKMYRTIERLAIVDCDQFTDAHAEELRGVLTESRFSVVGWTLD